MRATKALLSLSESSAGKYSITRESAFIAAKGRRSPSRQARRVSREVRTSGAPFHAPPDGVALARSCSRGMLAKLSSATRGISLGPWLARRDPTTIAVGSRPLGAHPLEHVPKRLIAVRRQVLLVGHLSTLDLLRSQLERRIVGSPRVARSGSRRREGSPARPAHTPSLALRSRHALPAQRLREIPALAQRWGKQRRIRAPLHGVRVDAQGPRRQPSIRQMMWTEAGTMGDGGAHGDHQSDPDAPHEQPAN